QFHDFTVEHAFLLAGGMVGGILLKILIGGGAFDIFNHGQAFFLEGFQFGADVVISFLGHVSGLFLLAFLFGGGRSRFGFTVALLHHADTDGEVFLAPALLVGVG